MFLSDYSTANFYGVRGQKKGLRRRVNRIGKSSLNGLLTGIGVASTASIIPTLIGLKKHPQAIVNTLRGIALGSGGVAAYNTYKNSK